MAWSGTPPNQTFSRTTGLQTGTTAWADTEGANRGIESTDHDTHDQDIATALNLALKKDGGNKATADIDWGGFKITNLADPAGADEAANKGYVDSVVTGFVNFTVRAASTANVNLTSDVDAGSTFDGISLVEADLILLKNQTDAKENGVYVVPAALGTAARSTSFDTWAEFVGSIINVTAGSAGTGLSFRCTVNTGGTVGSTNITYAPFGSSVTLPLSIAQGGHGQTTAALGFAALKQAATDTATGVVELATTAEVVTGTDTSRAVTAAGVAAALAAAGGLAAATQAEQETATSTAVAVTPGRQQFHPSAAKCWAIITVSGGTPTLAAGFNITSIADTQPGQVTVTIATDFSSANWAAFGFSTSSVTNLRNIAQYSSRAAGSIVLDGGDLGNNDPDAWDFVGYGDQA